MSRRFSTRFRGPPGHESPVIALFPTESREKGRTPEAPETEKAPERREPFRGAPPGTRISNLIIKRQFRGIDLPNSVQGGASYGTVVGGQTWTPF
jgi:hypothetical protein